MLFCSRNNKGDVGLFPFHRGVFLKIRSLLSRTVEEPFNQALFRLVKAEAISEEVALRSSDDPDELKLQFRDIGDSSGGNEIQQPSGSTRLNDLDMQDIFKVAIDGGVSDFLLTVGSPLVRPELMEYFSHVARRGTDRQQSEDETFTPLR